MIPRTAPYTLHPTDYEQLATDYEQFASVTKITAKVSGITALVTIVIQVAAKYGLFALPTFLKPVFFTSAVTLGAVTLSHFALACSALALVSWALTVYSESKASDERKKMLQSTPSSTPAPTPPVDYPNSSAGNVDTNIRVPLYVSVPPFDLTALSAPEESVKELTLDEQTTYFNVLKLYNEAPLQYLENCDDFSDKYAMIRAVTLFDRKIKMSRSISFVEFVGVIGLNPPIVQASAYVFIQSVLHLYLVYKFIAPTGFFMVDGAKQENLTAENVNNLVQTWIFDFPQSANFSDKAHRKITFEDMCKVVAQELNILASQRRTSLSV